MQMPVLELPKAVPVERLRQPQENIPQTRVERERLRSFIRTYVKTNRTELVPPLVLDELRQRAETIVRLTGLPAKYSNYVGVLVNNEVWREQLATVPYYRRLLLLPKCLR